MKQGNLFEEKTRPVVCVVGAGFAGIATAKRLAKVDVDVLLIDKTNHHLFQPLLYQVATAALSPAQIAQPIRKIMKKQKNCVTGLGEVLSVDTSTKILHTSKGDVEYDYLVLATGSTHTYFGNDAWEKHAPGLKTIDDALNVRKHILHAFEKAEVTKDENKRKALLTFVLVGAGPTGVEMAGAIAELSRFTLKDEFRRINPADARVILVEAGGRVLSSFTEKLSKKALKDLEALGVEVLTSTAVTNCTADGVQVGDEFIASKTIIWSAGVKASLAAQWLGSPTDRAGRVIVNSNLEVEGFENVFAIGDTAHVVDGKGKVVPGLAPAAVQQGRYVAKMIEKRVAGKVYPKPFVYKDWGIMATIGRGEAIAQIGKFQCSGFFAWAVWGLIHIMPLVDFRNRLVVAIDWVWSYFTGARGVRLITSHQDKSDTMPL